MSRPVLGIVGWKNSGKTTLITKIVAECSRRGYRVATVKHTHHKTDIDQEGTDSFRHRAAGAVAVALVSGVRWALIHELGTADEPTLEVILEHLLQRDIVLVEGYKREAIPKIETRRLASARSELLTSDDPNIIAVVADHPTDAEGRPSFDPGDVAGITDFIVAYFDLE
jgi:molybdopterin-guanine dinucleotide biosynthesis protein B